MLHAGDTFSLGPWGVGAFSVGGSERRVAERLRVCCKLEILAYPDEARPSAGPAHSVDISSGGICANTLHRLRPGDEVEVVISTADAAAALGIPASLCGRASVRRVEPQEGGWRKVALAFAPAFAQSMELAFYLAYLFGMQQADGAPATA